MVREINKRDIKYAKENLIETECHGHHEEEEEGHCNNHKAIYKLREKFKDSTEPETLWNYENLSKGTTNLNEVISRG
jgi:DNA-binding IscR family transcriptional regulator